MFAGMPASTTTQVGIRLDAGRLARLDAIRGVLSDAARGIEVSRAAVARLALDKLLASALVPESAAREGVDDGR